MENATAVQQAESQGTQDFSAPVKHNTDFSLGIFGSSDNFLMATQMAKAFASSTIVPKEYQGNFANGLVAMDIANRIKTSPFMVMQNLDVIQGRPAWRATFLIAMINRSNKYDLELQFEEKRDKNGKPYSCTCWTTKDGRKVTGIEVTMDMAEAEGWTKKNGSKWITMPQVMLRYRAASFFSRMNCPELSNGLYTTDEVYEMADNEYKVYNLEDEVKRDLAQNANKEEFVAPPNETAPESESKGNKPVDPAVENQKSEDTPDWMKPETM